MVDKEFLNDIDEQHAINSIVEIAFEGKKISTRTTWTRNLAVAVAMILLGIPIFGYTFPALAQHIPILASILTRIDFHEGDQLALIADYAIVIGETQIADGISITLSEAYFDGREIYLIYLVESEQPLNQNIPWFRYELDQEISVLIDGEEMPTGLLGNESSTIPSMFWLNDDHFFFILNIPLVQRTSPLLYEALSQAEKIEVVSNFSNFRLNLFKPDFVDLEELCEGVTHWEYDCWENLEREALFEIEMIAQGTWNFRIPVEQAELIRIPTNERIEKDDYEVGIHSIFVSSSRMIINYSIHSAFGTVVREGETYLNDVTVESGSSDVSSIATTVWQVVDDLGAPLSQVMRTGEHYTGSAGWGAIHFEPPSLEATQIIITPIVYEWETKLMRDEETGQESIHKGEFGQRIEFDPIVIELP